VPKRIGKLVNKSKISDNKYLFSLSAILLLISGLNILLIIFKIGDTNFEVNIFTSSIFTAFTIIFLTYAINTRETKRWRAVEDKILERISLKLYDLADSIDFYFLFSKLPEEYDKRIEENRPTNVKDYEHYKAMNRVTVEYYATHLVHLGETGTYLLQECSQEGILEIKHEFEKQVEYFEQLVGHYFLFLSPIQVNALMSIENSLNRIVKSCDDVRHLVGTRKHFSVCRHQFDEVQVELEEEIKNVFDQIYQLNKLGLGF
jgi:acyl carrier protein